jgi:hypothetical protein
MGAKQDRIIILRKGVMRFYSICRPKPTALIHNDPVEDGAAGEPRWIEVSGLCADNFLS